ncbi:hypothetical protein [Brevundimonas faecalis]|uniref:2-hydroxychromene-2-carboxylate isomerase n=1 Tax=Brevundimonas faecalis TaxID=947378 RepID=A0ABV2RET0_9CAUL
MQRRQLAQTIADALFQAEDSADISLRDASALINTLTNARLDHRLSAVLGADALSATTEAVRALGEARGRLVAAHQALAGAAPWLVGHNVVLTGPMTGKPDDATRPAGRLREVA